MKTEIKEIEFETNLEKQKSINYKKSGFYLVSEKECKTIDLMYVDKNIEYSIYLTPYDIFLKIKEDFVIEEEKQELKQEIGNNLYEGDFILEFAKILLNRK